MLLHQFYLNCLAHASYLVGDKSTHIAAIVDPQRDIGQYLAYASEHNVTIAVLRARTGKVDPPR